jgi:IS30 family transposase
MTEAMKWSVMKWLREKKNVRKAADQANAALDKLNREVKQSWPDSVKSAYEALAAQSATSERGNRNHPKPSSPTGELDESLLAKKLKDADDKAYRARAIAEDAFDEAEKQLSTRLAREGCLKAIHAWDILEEAIRRAERIRL